METAEQRNESTGEVGAFSMSPSTCLLAGLHQSQLAPADNKFHVGTTGKGDRFFTAVPSETKEQKATRLAREDEEKRQQEIETLRAEISERQTRLEALNASTPNDQAHASRVSDSERGIA